MTYFNEWLLLVANERTQIDGHNESSDKLLAETVAQARVVEHEYVLQVVEMVNVLVDKVDKAALFCAAEIRFR